MKSRALEGGWGKVEACDVSFNNPDINQVTGVDDCCGADQRSSCLASDTNANNGKWLHMELEALTNLPLVPTAGKWLKPNVVPRVSLLPAP